VDFVNPHFFGNGCEDRGKRQKARIAGSNRLLGEANQVSVGSV
jgi:hypothetical protein